MKRSLAALLALLLAIGFSATALAQDDGTVGVQVRVWQDISSPKRLYISARPAGGSWSGLGTVRLTLDDAGSSELRTRYDSVRLRVPLPGASSSGPSAEVEVRVEQAVDAPGAFFVSARGEGHFWSAAETAPLSLSASDRWFRYGEVSFEMLVSTPSQRHLDLQRYMLELINDERADAGLDPVELGDNDAAQLHAEASLLGCFSSHWGLDGLQPYMRYSLAGGYQSNAENGIGLDYCVTYGDFRRPLASIRTVIRDAMQSWIASPGHRGNILNPWHKAVSIGMAWDRHNFRAYQHFEGGYVEYEQLPSLENGVLALAGKVGNGPLLSATNDLRVQVYYDPPPHDLTLGQVTRTYCYDSGLPVAGLRWPLPPGRFYLTDEFTLTYQACPNPYDVATEAPGPSSPSEANAFWEAARASSEEQDALSLSLPWITAEEWTTGGNTFSLRADLSDVLTEHGPGVYTLVVWGNIGGEFVAISRYSLFHEVEPPEGYLQHR